MAVLREYSICYAGIRVAEANTQNLDITRLHIEGVVQEAFSSSDVSSYFTGRKTSIAARLNLKSKQLEAVFKGERRFNVIVNWNILSQKNLREAALVAIGAVS